MLCTGVFRMENVVTGTYGRMILISGMIPKEKAGKSDLHS